MAERIVTAQTDFSGGQIDEDAKRREDVKIVKTGARTMSNFRIRNTGSCEVRPGRTAVAFASGPRSERFRMSPAQELIITFSAGKVSITDTLGNPVASHTSAAYIWTNATVWQISWCTPPDRIVICYPGMPPQIVLWTESTNAFVFQPFAFRVLQGAHQEPFFRLADLGVTLKPSQPSGTGTVMLLVASEPIFTNSMVGSIISVGGQQALITGVGSTVPVFQCAVITLQPLPEAVSFQFDIGNPSTCFLPQAICQTSDSKIILEASPVQFSKTGAFTSLSVAHPNEIRGNSGPPNNVPGEWMVSVYGQCRIFTGGGDPIQQPTVTWLQEFMNALNGWPSACFYDRSRLGFCGFPQRPEAILWSAVGIYDVFWVDSGAAIGNPEAGAAADTAILEFMDGAPKIQNVVGWNGDQFVFTDRGIYYIPITTAGNPLKPGSVEFRLISDATASTIRPAVTRDALIFSSASNNRISAIIRTGNFTTPYAEQDLTQFHASLLNEPVTITVGHGDDGFPERYVYVLNSDGSLAVGKVQDDKSFVGWLPWSGAGAVSWVSSSGLTVLFNTLYGAQSVLEFENASYFLDHAVNYNSPPANMLAGGDGPLMAFEGQTVRVMDGAIDYGLRNVSAEGFLIPNPEDDFSSPTVVCGQAFTSQFSPFLAEGQLGPALGQRQRRRKISRANISVYGSSGFTWGGRTIPPYNFGDSALAQPPLRETSYRARYLGRDFEPEILLLKDTPGPLTLVECVQEVTV